MSNGADCSLSDHRLTDERLVASGKESLNGRGFLLRRGGCNRYDVPCYEMYGGVLWLVQAARGYTEPSVRSRDPEPVSLCGLEDQWREVPV